jgi:hypothetical protein
LLHHGAAAGGKAEGEDECGSLEGFHGAASFLVVLLFYLVARLYAPTGVDAKAMRHDFKLCVKFLDVKH